MQADITSIDPDKLKATVRHIVQLLAEARYAELEHWSKGMRLSADQLREAVTVYYPCTLMALPEEQLGRLDLLEMPGSVPREWYVGIDLWTREEGRSDLTLEITVIDNDDDLYAIEIDDLHVL